RASATARTLAGSALPPASSWPWLASSESRSTVTTSARIASWGVTFVQRWPFRSRQLSLVAMKLATVLPLGVCLTSGVGTDVADQARFMDVSFLTSFWSAPLGLDRIRRQF